MLEVSNLVAGYGRVPVLEGVSISVPEGQIVGVLGPNGAGKTTLARAISGLIPSHSGALRFDARDLRRLRAQEVVRAGIVHVPQGRMLFRDMSVDENLHMGAYLLPSRADHAAARERVHSLFPILAERRGQLAGLLSGGQQQMLAIGRALMGRPRLLILDEPSIGLAPRTMAEIFAAIGAINRAGTTVLLIEQNARRVLTLAGRCYVLAGGRIAAEGGGQALLNDDTVRESYLGLR